MLVKEILTTDVEINLEMNGSNYEKLEILLFDKMFET